MSILVQYLKFLKSSPAGNEKKEKTAALPGYEPQVTGEMPNKKKDEGELTAPITEHGLAKQETPKNINTFATKPVAMRSESSAAVPAFTQPVSNPGRGYNTGVPQPQAQQQPTKIPRVLARIHMANSVTDPKSGTLLDKQGSLGYSRNTGISDVEGEIYVNSNDVELLGKLGFDYSCEEYLGLEKTSEVLDVYSYIEKVAGVPKEVVKLIDDEKAFSAEYLKDMGYSVPKGYEVKGDLVCPVEKTEQSSQQTGKKEKGSSEKTASRLRSNVNITTHNDPSGLTEYIASIGDKKIGNMLVADSKHKGKVVAHSLIDPEFRGMGLGKKLYGEVMRRQPEGILHSGPVMSEDAQRIWTSLNKNKGYEIAGEAPELMGRINEKALNIPNKVKKIRPAVSAVEAKGSIFDRIKKLMGIAKRAEYKWHKSKDLHRDVTNGRHYPFSFLTGEAKELVDAIKKRDMANFKEEIGDTSYAAQMLAAQATGLNHPVYADLSKFHNREKIWKDIFKEKGSTYHPKHMEGGSNFAKPSKIIKALASAGIRISQKEAEKLANKYTGGKMEKEAAEAIAPPGSWTTPTGSWHRSEANLVNPKGRVVTNTPNSQPMVESPYADITQNVVLNVAGDLASRAQKLVPPGATNVLKNVAKAAPLHMRALGWVAAKQAVPAFNAAVGAADVHNRLQREDYPGAAISGVGVAGDLAQLAPTPLTKGIGAGVSWGSTGANAARDLHMYNNRPVEFRNTPPSVPQSFTPQISPIQIPSQALAKQSAADHPVASSNIKAVGHDTKKKILDVAFHSGSEYLYKDVPRSLYARLLKAKSPGKFFNKHIKQDKPFEYEKVASTPTPAYKSIAKLFQPAEKVNFRKIYPTAPTLPPGVSKAKWRADVAENIAQHQALSNIRKNVAAHQAAFNFNVPNAAGVDELHNVWIHPEIMNTNQLGKGLAEQNRTLANLIIENTQTGKKWSQPMYRSTGTNNEATVGQWLPTRGFGAPSEDWVNAVKTKINPEFEMPVSVDAAVPQFLNPSNQGVGGLKGPGWLGKYQFDPTTQQWLVHDKGDTGKNALLPVYQRLRDALGEYMTGI